MTNEPQTPAGWYPDGSGRLRWWDGSAWSEHFAPLGAVALPPVSGQISGFVFGLVGFLFCAIPVLGVILGLIGWGMSWKAIKSLERGDSRRVLPMFGLVLGIVGTCVGLIATFGLLFSAVANT